MELVFSRKDMMSAMKMVSRAAGKSSALPVLSNVLVSAAQDPLWSMLGSSGDNGDGFYLAATDLEVGIRMKVPGRIIENGAITLPARTFASVISALSEDDVKLVTANGRARIHSEKGEFKMVGTSADEFPSMMGEVSQDAQLELTEQPKDEKEMHFLSLDSDVLGWMIRKTAFAASRDDARYFLNGVHLSLKSEGDGTMLRMAATDGTRLAVAGVAIEEALENEVGAIVPNRAVKELEKLAASSDEMRIGLQENRIVFDAGDTALVSALLEGQFPDYQQVIPDGSKTNLKVDTGHLLTVIKRISQVSNPKLPCVKLETTGNRMKVSASSVNVGDGCEEMDVGSPTTRKKKDLGSPSAREKKDGDDVAIAVNGRYMMDALRVIDTQETLIGIDSEVKPIVIKPSSGDHLCILMPVRL